MKKRTITLLVTALLALSAQSAAYAQSGSLKECRALEKKIEQYSDLRRGGGKASQMDAWKRELRRSESRFRELDCADYGDELR